MAIYFVKSIHPAIEYCDILIFIALNLILVNVWVSYFVKDPVYSMLLIILNYCILGSFFIWSGAEFMGLIFLMIYVGAISVLLLFSFMLLDFRVIFHKSFKKKHLWRAILSVWILEFVFFHLKAAEKMYFYDNYNYYNWFKLLFATDDSISISYEIFQINSELLILIGLFLLVMLISSVSIVAGLKTSKSQDFYLQLKPYNYNLLSKN